MKLSVPKGAAKRSLWEKSFKRGVNARKPDKSDNNKDNGARKEAPENKIAYV